MSFVRIRPGAVFGRLRAPASKSYTHRALVVGHLAHRPFRVLRPLDSGDTRATASALQHLGTSVHREAEVWHLSPSSRRPGQGAVRIQCHESGTTLRFVSAIAGLEDRTTVISGEGRLSSRPIDPLLAALKTLGATCRHTRGRGLPIEVRGPMHGGSVSLDASESSQFASALLLAMPTLSENSVLELTGKVVSRPYLEATLAVLAYHGIRVARHGRRFRIAGGQHFRGRQFLVPGDASSAAYLWAAASVSGGRVRVDGVGESWPQADLAVLDLLESAGANVERSKGGVEVSAGRPRPFRVDLTDAPDLYSLAGVLAATTPGESRITGAEHVALKESNRKAATAQLARRLGGKVDERPSGLTIRGTSRPKAVELPRLSDHRLVMSAAVGALAASGPSIVGERQAVRKSYPGFWRALREIADGGYVS
ncbi:MAG: 3-phosphoshikimate 1-carboxyvinyltransferase [Thermoplasmata archaeon]|nr:3-phosphoshikimate 1-carboxyvinyltransferase [Thermoplasmata archaeon]